ncbi:MAG: PspC domain-containing protein [Bacteroidetes bacterium]|nr:PspC domain-containing protein [Bacteroidota bacterium]
MNNQTTFYRSRINRIIGGVCGGLSERLNFDVSILRLIFVLLTLFGGGGLLIYIVLWIIVPERPWELPGNSATADGSQSDSPKYEPYNKSYEPYAGPDASGNKMRLLLGAGLIFAGILFLMANFISWLNVRDLWPVVLIITGLALLFSQYQSSK